MVSLGRAWAVVLVALCAAVSESTSIAADEAVGVHFAHVSLRPKRTESDSREYRAFVHVSEWHSDEARQAAGFLLGARSFAASQPKRSPLLRSQFVVVWKRNALAGVGGVKAHLKRAAGVEVSHYIPNNAFIIYCNAQEAERVRKVDGVLWVGKVDPAHKVSASLAALVQPQMSGVGDADSVFSLSVLFVSENAAVEGIPDLAKRLGTTLKSRVRVERIGRDSAQVVVPRHVAGGAARALLEREDIHWVERTERMVPFNKYTRAIVQSGHNTVAVNNTPIWERGIDGQNEVVGCGDTGLDYRHCFFYDASVTVSFNQALPSHRKIAAYSFFSGTDVSDQAGGHGTHVVGSILGVPEDTGISAYEYRGAAPGARVAFFDLQGPANPSGLSVPNDLENDYFKIAYDFGARLHSNSWGSNSNSYSTFSRASDSFVYNHPDMLPLFAVGNSGASGRFTVSSPSTAKNVLSIGAEQSTYESFQVFNRTVPVVHVTTSPELRYEAPAASFNPDGVSPVSGTMVVTSPVEACSSLSNSAQVNGKIAVIKRGTCTFVDKVKNAQNAGAVGVVVYNNVDGAAFAMAGVDASITILSVMVQRVEGEALVSRIGSGTTSGSILLESSSFANMHNLADFSSRGPTFDMRMKPDVVAPGQWLASSYASGTSSQSCLLTLMQGTSMATPTAAGAAALVRQYFRSGYYPSGVANASDALQPSAALVKAMMIQSAKVLSGVYSNLRSDESYAWESLSTKPNYDAGFGRIQLDSVLRFSTPLVNASRGVNYAASPFALIIRDSDTVAQGSANRHCFTAQSNPESLDFKATVVWSDVPASSNAYAALVNDLDVTANINGAATLVYGNGHTDAMSGSGPFADRVNNVEQIWIPAANITAGDAICVNVIGWRVTTTAQSYALAVTGAVAAATTTGSVSCPQGCNSRGTCTSGSCSCNAGYYGAACEKEVTNVNLTSTAVVQQVDLNEWRYFTYSCQSVENCTIRVNVSQTVASGDADVYVRRNAMPTLSEFNYRDLVTDVVGKNEHLVVVNRNGELSNGEWVIGVYGGCCGSTAFSLHVQKTTLVHEDDGGGGNPGVAIAIVVCIVAIVCLFVYARRNGWFSSGGTLTVVNSPQGAPSQRAVTNGAYPMESYNGNPHATQMTSVPVATAVHTTTVQGGGYTGQPTAGNYAPAQPTGNPYSQYGYGGAPSYAYPASAQQGGYASYQ